MKNKIGVSCVKSSGVFQRVQYMHRPWDGKESRTLDDLEGQWS